MGGEPVVSWNEILTPMNGGVCSIKIIFTINVRGKILE